MTELSAEVLASRIHDPGCPWQWSWQCTDAFIHYRQIDAEAVEMLVAQAERAHRRGVPPAENTNQSQPRHASHRCPVGNRVLDLPDHGFTDAKPMPWTGELYAETADGRTLLRLYFIERRAAWAPPTIEIVGCGIGTKPVSETEAWTSDDQTRDILGAMKSGVERCENVRSLWRRWNTA